MAMICAIHILKKNVTSEINEMNRLEREIVKMLKRNNEPITVFQRRQYTQPSRVINVGMLDVYIASTESTHTKTYLDTVFQCSILIETQNATVKLSSCDTKHTRIQNTLREKCTDGERE